MFDPKLDQYTQILNGRRMQHMSDTIYPKSEHRRIQAYQILDHYLCADSANAILELPDSLHTWWLDPGTMKAFAGVFAKLICKGLRLQPKDQQSPKQEKALNQWVQKTRLYRLLRQCCRDTSVYGDSVLQPVWDDALGMPKLDVLHPGWYVPFSQNRVVLIWLMSEDSKVYHIEDYMLGTRAVEKDGALEVTTEKRVGMRMANIEYTEGNLGTKTLLEYLTGPYTPVPFETIPVVHIKNGEEGGNGFGTSDFSTALDMMDTYHQILTDKRRQSRFMIPPIGVRGNVRFAAPDANGVIKVQYEPGMFVGLGPDGGFDTPDFSALLTAANAEKDNVRVELLRACGITKAALGELGEVSNLRELEIKLIFAPIDNEVQDRRADFETPFMNCLKLIEELWLDKDKAGYNAVFGSTKLSEMELVYDEVMPLDVKGMLDSLVEIRPALDRETYTREVMAARGIKGDPAAVAAKAADEEKGVNGISEFPAQ